LLRIVQLALSLYQAYNKKKLLLGVSSAKDKTKRNGQDKMKLAD